MLICYDISRNVILCDYNSAARTARYVLTVKSVGHNARRAYLDHAVSDLLNDVDRTAPYTICTANIVADIIIRMAPDIGALLADGAVYITSGIITERADEVRAAMTANNFAVLDEVRDNGWTAFAFTQAR